MSVRILIFGIVLGLATHYLPSHRPAAVDFWHKTVNFSLAPHFPNHSNHRQPAPPSDAQSPHQNRKLRQQEVARIDKMTVLHRLPTYFLSHGSPSTMFQPQSGPYKSWAKIGQEIQKLSVKGVVFVSAHWESDSQDILVTEQTKNELLYDYFGFPSEYYEVKFKSVASPELSQKVIDTLQAAGISARGTRRGFDHGLFVPARAVFGETTKLPFVQVSLPRSTAPAESIELGKALASLRDQRYLVLTGGMICHNLRDFRANGRFDSQKLMGYERPFTAATSDLVHAFTGSDREKKALDLAQTANFHKSHPTLEHILPLYVSIGAAGADEGEVLFTEVRPSLAYLDVRFGHLEPQGEEIH